MKSDWLRGEKTTADKEEFKQLLSVSKPVLDKLLVLCYNKRKAYDESKYAKPDYTDSAWPLIQADTNGYVRALTEIAEIIESVEE